MNRLQAELHRLYLPRSQPPVDTDAAAAPPALIDASGGVRALVFELTRPPSWALLSAVWQGVQAELELPAPAIAVSGADGLQLWFSLAEPIASAQAHAFLDRLRARFLPEIAADRVRLWPEEASALQPAQHTRLVPARQAPGENWSAFLAPDLAPVFADAPWLDIPPNEEGQAALLRGLGSMQPAAFDAALQRLAPAAPPHSIATPAPAPWLGTQESPTHEPPGTEGMSADPRQFLLQVMNDDRVALALRIDAAKALLQHSTDHRPPPGPAR